MNLAQISSSLIFITTIATLTGKKLNNSSIRTHSRIWLDTVIPLHYDIELDLTLEKYDSNIEQQYGIFNFYGESSVDIDILSSTQYIKFHTSDLTINQKKCILIDQHGGNYIPEEFLFDFEEEYLLLCFVNILSPGRYTLKIEFYGLITDNNAENFVRSSYINEEEDIIWLIAPHIEMVGARRLFPCWDEPHLSTTFNISIKHHRNFTVLSNSPIRTNYTDDNDLMWTHFNTTPPMSTYQVSVILTNLPPTRINENITLWCKMCSRQSIKYAEQVIKNITLHLASEFNEIKIPKMDHIAIPNLPYNGMSKWGLIFHREADLICGKGLDAVMRKIEIARSVAPKIAYQWLGNVISPFHFWWSHFWLHDGLAILYGEEAVVKIFNNSQIMDLFVVQSQYDSLHLDSHFAMNFSQINSLSEIDLIFSSPRYMKVIIVLRMLQNAITDEVFRKSVRTCLNNSETTLEEFWSIQEDLANHLGSKYYMPKDFLNWIIFKHYPTVIYWSQVDPFHGKLFQINASRRGEVSSSKWRIPLSLITKSSLKEADKVLLTPEKPYLDVEHTARDGWLMVDIQQAGYYRVHYGMDNLLKIALYLNSEDYKNISVINRAKIIDDAFYFLLAREINETVFWRLAKYLVRDTDYVAWYPMFKVFEYISSVLPLSKDNINFTHVKKTMREILTKPLEILGSEERPMENDFTKCLRQEIAKWACTVELSECLQMAKFKLKQYLDNLEHPETIKEVLPEWKEWTYCNGFKNSMGVDMITRPRLAKYGQIKLWPDIDANKYVEYITCFNDNDAVDKIFQILKHKKSELGRLQYGTKKDINININIFHSLIARHAKDEVILKKIFKKFHDIQPPEISTTATLINIVNHIYNTTLLNMLSMYVKNEKSLNLGQLAPKVYSKLETRLSEIERQIGRLDMLINYKFGSLHGQKPSIVEKSDINKTRKYFEDMRRLYQRTLMG